MEVAKEYAGSDCNATRWFFDIRATKHVVQMPPNTITDEPAVAGRYCNSGNYLRNSASLFYPT